MKKKTSIYLIILLTLIVINACSQKPKFSKQTQKEYLEIQKLYPDYFTNHFPKLNEGTPFSLEMIFPRGRYINYIHLLSHVNDKEKSKVLKMAEENAIAKYHFQDSCLMIVNYNEELYNESPIQLRNCQHDNLLPVSNFNFCIEAGLSENFYKNATIYVLGSEKGEFLEESYLSKEGVGFTEEWNHGYTKGVIISGYFAAYWLEVW